MIIETIKDRPEVPIWHKLNLTIEEAAAYSGIGINKLREIAADPECDFVIAKGTHRMIKRKQFEQYNDNLQVI